MKILVFGTGNVFKSLRFNKNVKILAFLDNDPLKCGKIINGITIYSPNDVEKFEFDFLIIASHSIQRITAQLRQAGVPSNKILAVMSDNWKQTERNLKILDHSLAMRFTAIKASLYGIVYKATIAIAHSIQPKQSIVYTAHKGEKYACNPKAIFEYAKEHLKEDYTHIWMLTALKNMIPESHNPKAFAVKPHSLKGIWELSRAAVIISNTDADALNPLTVRAVRKDTVFLNTWHAAGAFKTFGNAYKSHIGSRVEFDYFLCSSPAARHIFSDSLDIAPEKIMTIGLPRTDILYHTDRHQKMIADIRNRYAVPADKKIMLYAPTWRDTSSFGIPFDYESIIAALGNEWVILLRGHHYIEEISSVDSRFIDVSLDDDMNPFLIAADALITDYSSVIFEYAVFKRPIIFFANDFEQYAIIRDFYFEYTSFVPGPIATTDEQLYELCRNIENIRKQYGERLEKFANAWLSPFDGQASRRACELLFGKESLTP